MLDVTWLVAHGGGGGGASTRSVVDAGGIVILGLIVVAGVLLVAGASTYVRRGSRTANGMAFATIAIFIGVGTLGAGALAFGSLAYREEKVPEEPVTTAVEGDAGVKIRFLSATDRGDAHLTVLNQDDEKRRVSCEIGGVGEDGEPATAAREPFVTTLKPRVAQELEARLDVVAPISRMVARCEGSPVGSHASMDHGAGGSEASGRGGIMPGLCRVRRQIRSGSGGGYDIYSSTVMGPLHSMQNELQDADPPSVRSLIRAENDLEIALLSGAGGAEGRLEAVGRVVRLLRPELRRLGLRATC